MALEISSINFYETAIDQKDSVECSIIISNLTGYLITDLLISFSGPAGIAFAETEMALPDMVQNVLVPGQSIDHHFRIITEGAAPDLHSITINCTYKVNQSVNRSVRVRPD